MRIAVDIDNVLADTANAVLKGINKKYNTKFTEEDVSSWDHRWDINGTTISYTDELFELYDTFGFLYSIPAYKDGVNAVRNMIHNNHEVFLLTGRMPKYKPMTDLWANRVYPNITVRYADGKEKYSDLFDVLIDDSPREVKNVSRAGKHVLLMDRPWNRDVPKIYGKRVYNWNEVMNCIKYKLW